LNNIFYILKKWKLKETNKNKVIKLFVAI